MSLTLTNIPSIMRAHHWFDGAALMDKWFAGPAAVSPAYTTPDTTTIQMDAWALTYERARTVYDKLMADRVWANAAAQKQLAKVLRRKGLLGSRRVPFGDLGQPAPVVHEDYVNFRAIGGDYSGTYYGSYYYPSFYYYYTSGLDDMTAALGNFAFHIAVAGEVQPVDGGYQAAITEVGVYIKDSYDFEGDQHLGFWDDSDNSVSAVNFFAGTRVTNADFRQWRRDHGAGGDFLVFSDIKRTVLTDPDVFDLP
jgi:hypothetical protein